MYTMGKRLGLPDKKICDDYIDGMSTIEIAKIYNCSEQTISNRLHENNIKIRSNSESHKNNFVWENNPRFIDVPTDEICTKYISGMNMNELVLEYNCSRKVILNRLHRNDIYIRSNSESHMGVNSGDCHPKYIELPIKEISEDYINGLSTVQIAEKYNCSETVINNRLHDNGIQIRSLSDVLVGKGGGENNPNWKGGISLERHLFYTSTGYTQWRTSVFERDNYTCQECGRRGGGIYLNCHHILPYRDHPEPEYSLNINNGITLCEKCHRETYGREYDFMPEFLGKIFDDKAVEIWN